MSHRVAANVCASRLPSNVCCCFCIAALHLAQPTVSTQLKELASSLGLVLFEPHGRGLAPTAAAEQLAQAVRDMAARWQQFEEEAAALQGLRQGRLRSLEGPRFAISD